MTTASEDSYEETSSIEQEDKENREKINIGLYIGGRNSRGERDGRGWAILPNGDQYDGQYRKGQRHGTGLYVFKDGSRYFGQYRCGVRSGRGIFIYPDGSFYEGSWRKNLKHGKGRYIYGNGDTYCGDWCRGQRHGVGTYTSKALSSNAVCGCVKFIGTWRRGIRVGPFQLNFGTEDKSTTLHGTWDNLYPQGPCVFSFNNQYMLTGYFQSPVRAANLGLRNKTVSQASQKNFSEETIDLEENEHEDQYICLEEPSLWYAQEMYNYDISILPQEPVPLPLSDSDISVCSLSTVTAEISIKEPFPVDEEETKGDGDLETFSCECLSSGVESISCVPIPFTDPCAI